MGCAEIIRRLGGAQAVAEYLGCSRQAVGSWTRNGVPARYWHRVVSLCREHGIEGVSIESLEAEARMLRERRQAAARKPSSAPKRAA